MKSGANSNLLLSNYYVAGQELQHQQPHFLEACNLCSKTLDHTTDIYMYRGNTPFCSEECRQEQIGIDEAIREKKKRSSTRPASNKQTSSDEIIKKSTTTSSNIQSGTLVVA